MEPNIRERKVTHMKQKKRHCLFFFSLAALSFPMHMLYKVFPMKNWVIPLLLFWSEFEFLLLLFCRCFS